ncbi:unnamed protein product [Closterium sp. NIES-64]|nr:unnamed protein product [Closterium sp. NIES-64]
MESGSLHAIISSPTLVMSPPIPTKASAVSLAANHHHRSASGAPNAKRQRCSDGSVAADASPEKAADLSRPKSCFIMLEEDGDDEITAADIAWCDDGSYVEIDTDALFALDEEPSAKTRSAHDSEQLSDELSQEHRGASNASHASHERQGNGGSGSSCESGETLSEKQNKSGEEGSAKRTSKEGRSKRKVKVDWTPSLHRKFVQAVEALGVERAIPSRILELMGDAALTRHNIASHLQKYRSHRRHLLAKEAEAATLHARAPAHAPPPDPSSWTPLRRDGTAWVPASVASSVLSPRSSSASAGASACAASAIAAGSSASGAASAAGSASAAATSPVGIPAAQTAVGIPPAHAGAMAAGHAGIMSPRGNVAVGFPPTFPQSSAAHAGMPAHLAGAGVGGTASGMLPGGGRVVIGRPVTGACGPRSLLRVMPSANGAPASAATAGTPGMSGTMLGMPLHLWGRSPARAEQANASARGWGSLQTGVPAHGSAGGAGGSGTVMMGGAASSGAWYGNGGIGGGAPTGYHHHQGYMHPHTQQAQQGYPMGMHVDAWGRPMATMPQHQQQYPQQLQASPYMSSSSYGMPYHMSYPMPSPDAAAASAAAASTSAAAGPYPSAMLVYPGAAAAAGAVGVQHLQHQQHTQHHAAAPFACSSPCSSLGSLPGFPAASSSTATTSHSARTCSDASPAEATAAAAAAAPAPAAEAPAVAATAAATAGAAGGLAEAAAGDSAAAAATAAGGDDSSAGDNKPDADACAGAASDAATKGEDCAAGMQQQQQHQAKEEEEEHQEQVQQVKQEQGVVEEEEEDPEALFADSLFHDHDDLSLLLHMPSSPVHDPNSTTDALDLLNHFPMDAALSHLMWTEGYMGGSGTESDDDEVAECKSLNPVCLKPIAPPLPTRPTPVL